MNVFDASALLAYLHGEPGADGVEAALVEGGVRGAANWSWGESARIRQIR